MQIIDEFSTPEEKEQFFKNNPSSLCKYRVWGDLNHKRVITHSELFFSSPNRFNDPYDCALPFKQHADNSNPEVIKEMVERTAPSLHPDKSRAELEEICAKQVLLIQQDPENWFEMHNGYKPKFLNKIFGILSLTPHSNNYLMWSHYADSHKGFCVEFDTRLLVESIKGHYQKVEHCDEIPEFSIRDNLNDSIFTKLLYTKSKTWEYEDEYRISRIHGADTVVNFNPDALIGIYFGCKMSFENQKEIICCSAGVFAARPMPYMSPLPSRRGLHPPAMQR